MLVHVVLVPRFILFRQYAVYLCCIASWFVCGARMYVCMYVCMNGCMYVCMYACIYICLYFLISKIIYIKNIHVNMNMQKDRKRNAQFTPTWSCDELEQKKHSSTVIFFFFAGGTLMSLSLTGTSDKSSWRWVYLCVSQTI